MMLFQHQQEDPADGMHWPSVKWSLWGRISLPLEVPYKGPDINHSSGVIRRAV